jgi:hypothetical protein
MRDRRPAELGVERLHVAGEEQPAAQALQLGMRLQRLEHLPRQALPAMRRQHEHVGEIGEGRAVGDHPGEGDLLAVRVEHADAEAVRHRRSTMCRGMPLAQ